jgi:alkanesulfonate monooxygenase SsuD/methylene tetrahydromethanopterin reductase-like flavin-dependent oxidoreductase (luciferase family)
MKFGLNLGGGNLPQESREEALYGRLEKSRLAKMHGYSSLWSGSGYLNNDFHPMLLLSRVAAEAPGLQLGIVALLPLYHPVEAAEQIATLDVISGGKFVLAPALGWRDYQFDGFGIPKSQRLTRFREVLTVMKQLWTEDRVSFAGTHFRINDIPGGGKPLQIPYPPIYIAANQDRGVIRAAKQGDGWLVSSRSTITTIACQSELYKKTAQESSKEPYISAWREMFVAETREKAIEIARPHVEWLYKDRAASGHSNELPEADRIDVGFDEVLKDRFIIGNPDDCIREIYRYKELGIQELILRCQWPGMSNEESLQAVNIFGREVIPEFN